MKNLIKTANYVSFKTKLGEFLANVYVNETTKKEHIVLFKGNIINKKNILTRIHSCCITSEVLHNTNCECQEQLDKALKEIQKTNGLLLYMDQEGRGIGLGPKLRAYELQDKGLNSAEANIAVGSKIDEREYCDAIEILEDLNIASINLLTNNPDKVNQLKNAGITVSKVTPHVIQDDKFKKYYEMKNHKLGHHIDISKFFSNKPQTA
ncbi:GTP cyclohydrolase II [bacterium]|jgi:GTP cyclohydrolase II|nr:GTP cyclohydrolase II [bacterium]MBT6293989.1 GTP cyclohydrolase II [bacterium]